MREKRTENREKRRAPRGFTLIELMVVCGIMAVIAGIILANQNKFGGQVLLQNFAYDMALSVRQAQVYGIAVQGYNAEFNAGYGIHFDSSPTRYLLFADANNNGVYDSTGGVDVLKKNYDITRGYTLKDKCVSTVSGETCGLQSLDIVFERPEPDALISWQDSTGFNHSCKSGDCASSARVIVQSPRNETMSVRISNNGQIAVDQVVTN